jgi:hypothetical protein
MIWARGEKFSSTIRVRRNLMTAEQIVQELKSLGQDSYKKVLLNHGAAYIKKVQQRGAIGKKRKTAKC